MIRHLLSITLILGIVIAGKCQKVELVFKDGAKGIKEVIAYSKTEVYFKGATINYSTIESIRFDSDRLRDKGLQEQLSIAGVKVFIHEQQKIIDVDRINEEPRRGNKNIILVCSDSLDLLYRRIGRHLAMKGYGIENSSKDFLTIKTTLRNTSRMNYSYSLNVLVIDKKVVFSAQWKLNNGVLVNTRESGLFDWEYTNDKKGTFEMTINSALYNDLMENLSDFERIRMEYK